jgi:hypothetical protein
VGQRLNELPLDDVALRLYGRAAKTVAASTALTEFAAVVLQDDPTRVRDLIRSNQLSVDEVGREFQRLLALVCKDYDEVVRGILARLVSSETERPARQWISGATLSARDAELLGVPASIDSADRVSSLLGAIAAMHKAVGRPFVILVDELEHFARYDVSQRSWGNVTWLKRLLEHLGNAGALALVAGHWDAWKATADYLDRFPQRAPIDLVKLKADDIAAIVQRFLGSRSSLIGEQECRAIAALTDGNMRRVMSLCNLLFRQTDGFARPLSEAAIGAAWKSLARRIPQEQALEETANLLDRRGFDVRLDSAFRGLHFDLVAERASDGRVVVVEVKHVSTQNAHYEAVRRFIDKLGAVSHSPAQAIGLFLVNGSIDDELLSVLRSSRLANLRWFDLTARDVMDRIGAEIAALDGVAAPPARAAGLQAQTPESLLSALPSMDTQAEALQRMAADFEARLHALDQKRAKEVQELQERLSEATRQASPRQGSIDKEAEVNPERARARYEAMLEPPSTNKKLRYMGSFFVIGVAYFVLGLVAIFFRVPILESLYLDNRRSMSFALILSGVGAAITGLWMVWYRYSSVTDYFEFCRQTIRDLYLRDVPIDELEAVNLMLRRKMGHGRINGARIAAIMHLEDGFGPVVRSYVRESQGRYGAEWWSGRPQ